jgi:hypothetical protein
MAMAWLLMASRCLAMMASRGLTINGYGLAANGFAWLGYDGYGLA